ncbi:MAG: helix-turn-helix transcriptional regulator [Alphaproteobacteria bacterium]|nr:helix-turn-helix transcriptional regulator [Alphaproteobacteria bacterium]
MRSPCPISNALDIIGDKWTLLVMRDILMFEKSQYSEFLSSWENISTNILAERLKRLEEAGLISKEPYQTNPVRYRYSATAAGKTLKPIIRAMGKWGLKNIPGTRTPTKHDLESLEIRNKRPSP